MKYLFAKSGYFLKVLKNKKIFLFLDYDGTLVSIKNTPFQAKVTNSTKKILKFLIQKSNIKICIISGREINDLKKMVGLKNIIYAGNHGLKIFYANKNMCLKKISSYYYMKLNEIKNKIKGKFKREKGIILEDKKEIFSLHYRLVDLKRQRIVIKKIKNLIKPYKKNLKLRYGKKVIEILPQIKINKGIAVKVILKKINNKKFFYPVYIGDDKTDEDAFKVLKTSGLTICVGKKRTNAEFFLNNVKEVIKFLKLLRDYYE